MNIDKAIESLSQFTKDGLTRDIHDFNDALKLGIEALTAIRDFRKDWSGNRFHLLPGETVHIPTGRHAPQIYQVKP